MTEPPRSLPCSTAPVIIVCYVPEEGGISDVVRKKLEAEVSRAPGVLLGRLDVEQQQGHGLSMRPCCFACFATLLLLYGAGEMDVPRC